MGCVTLKLALYTFVRMCVEPVNFAVCSGTLYCQQHLAILHVL